MRQEAEQRTPSRWRRGRRGEWAGHKGRGITSYRINGCSLAFLDALINYTLTAPLVTLLPHNPSAEAVVYETINPRELTCTVTEHAHSPPHIIPTRLPNRGPDSSSRLGSV